MSKDIVVKSWLCVGMRCGARISFSRFLFPIYATFSPLARISKISNLQGFLSCLLLVTKNQIYLSRKVFTKRKCFKSFESLLIITITHHHNLPYICCIPFRSSSGSTKLGWIPWYQGNIRAPLTELWLNPSECPNSCAATAKSDVPGDEN